MIINNTQTESPYTPINSNESTPQTYLEISAAAFNHNASFYKNLIGHYNMLAAVIKGNGYGHGLHQMAYLCEQNSFIDWLLVAQLSEALAVQNITKPILVMNYCDVSAEYAMGKNIHFMVDSFAYAQNLNTIGKKHSYQFSIHLKIDTGLCRMGVLANEALTLITQLQNLDYIQLNGICSHFAASDTNPEFTAQQYSTFNNIIADLNVQNISIPHVHMSNSAAISIVDYKDHFNFFRTGIGLYGLGHERSNLQPIMSWKTTIVNIKTVPANSYISYASTYQTTRVTRIALLPVGYFDGYKFRFSNKTSVIINGSPAPVLGRIAMNMTIVDVTDVPANIGDEVILLGAKPHVNAHDLALQGEVPNVREILVGINPSIARIITQQ